ncbi:MAG: purine-nucleoside phosphorylase [Bacillota bacterium]|uniref:Purine nucleoside phosphorylase n=1 Tax=Virgibacillus salarius TaxID=447199 RepID=A0A941DVX6_9BACI|nr:MULTISPECIES: purine-nucleoside phosphorylase [Bacillaceae]NAZ10405.1 purine-nucleoside phosphorylase [Agaribacter marinus]MBR7797695.1 purine-nucleoside phosphorylase [Virgibacillus salarius]MCC2249138.1 purine-nucleoside phosphorylase [Virgibacillus sp. AGTR]MDY7043440.1 purine-nucleoside phosphorylase [Virgibacillus sp. M23]QRZ16954.1 purine-nucleoside phosphorylase [Virgibacillus sp. AGTR]
MNYSAVREASEFLQQKLDKKPEIGLILGSGLGVLAEEIESPITIPYKDIPDFPESTVAGHKGQLVAGTLKGKQVIAMQGRFHYYEGYTMQQVTFPVRVMKELGIESIIVTNAAGGINEDFKPGDLMLISDHINNMGDSPLIGKNDEHLGVRFPDMSNVYDKSLIAHAEACAKDIQLHVQKGVYVGNTGPAYETPAEVRMLRTLGGDAVGMSTVPEVTVAGHAGIRVLGISCISNMAAGILDQPLTHHEVIETTEQVRESFLTFVKKVIETLPQND